MKQLVDLVDDLGDAGVGAVDLVDARDDRQVRGQRLAQHEAGLRQRALGGVDEQHDAVDHGQAALDLAAEVGVAGGVDDVDRHVLGDRGRGDRRVHRGVLREDRDALLALEVHRVHDARSSTSACSRNAPDCQSMASTRVVLPWSTWAMMATLRIIHINPRRRSSRRCSR
jgi:hypothetical protein